MKRVIAAAALVAAACLARAEQIDPVCNRILAPTEAETLAGVKPLALVDASQVRFATGTCNYATKAKSERSLVFLVSVTQESRPHEFDQFRSISIGPKAAHGLGDEAFTAEGVVGFRKGKTIVSVGSFVDPKTGKHHVAQSKLVELAKVLAARI